MVGDVTRDASWNAGPKALKSRLNFGSYQRFGQFFENPGVRFELSSVGDVKVSSTVAEVITELSCVAGRKDDLRLV